MFNKSAGLLPQVCSGCRVRERLSVIGYQCNWTNDPERFCKNMPPIIGELKNSLENRDAKNVQLHGHSIKGSAANASAAFMK